MTLNPIDAASMRLARAAVPDLEHADAHPLAQGFAALLAAASAVAVSLAEHDDLTPEQQAWFAAWSGPLLTAGQAHWFPPEAERSECVSQLHAMVIALEGMVEGTE